MIRPWNLVYTLKTLQKRKMEQPTPRGTPPVAACRQAYIYDESDGEGRRACPISATLNHAYIAHYRPRDETRPTQPHLSPSCFPSVEYICVGAPGHIHNCLKLLSEGTNNSIRFVVVWGCHVQNVAPCSEASAYCMIPYASPLYQVHPARARMS